MNRDDPDEAGAAGAGDDLSALSFEELVDRLEAIASKMADGSLGIELAADFYEQAQRLHAAAAARLEAVARRIDGLPGDGG